MSRPVEKALNELIPRLAGPLPPELIELASSLLAQSRNKISNLKAEEEIGRTFACANLACERLKTTLNLPPIEPRPPCPPRVYARLYSYFDRALPSSTSTPSRRARQPRPPSPSRPLPSRHAPPPTKSLEGFRTPRRGLRGGKAKHELPRWIGPAVRQVCKELGAGRAMPHVLAGVESVMLLPCPGPEDGDEDVGGERMSGKTPALIAAVFSFVMVRLTGQQTDTKQYNEQVRRVLSVLRELREDEAALARIGEGEEAWKGWEEVRKKDVDDWLKEISNHGWLRMAWWENIIDGSGASGEVEIEPPESEEEREDADEEEESKRLREVRAGSMRQEEFDYLSETKREQFARWKKLMLVKIDELVQSGILEEEGEDTEMRDVS